MSKTRFFLTVDWCKEGKRGIFCSLDGYAYSSDSPHSENEMFDILGPFALILSPKSIAMTEEEVKEYTKLYPLEEYSNQFGIARKA